MLLKHLSENRRVLFGLVLLWSFLNIPRGSLGEEETRAVTVPKWKRSKLYPLLIKGEIKLPHFTPPEAFRAPSIVFPPPGAPTVGGGGSGYDPGASRPSWPEFPGKYPPPPMGKNSSSGSASMSPPGNGPPQPGSPGNGPPGGKPNTPPPINISTDMATKSGGNGGAPKPPGPPPPSPPRGPPPSNPPTTPPAAPALPGPGSKPSSETPTSTVNKLPGPPVPPDDANSEPAAYEDGDEDLPPETTPGKPAMPAKPPPPTQPKPGDTPSMDSSASAPTPGSSSAPAETNMNSTAPGTVPITCTSTKAENHKFDFTYHWKIAGFFDYVKDSEKFQNPFSFKLNDLQLHPEELPGLWAIELTPGDKPFKNQTSWLLNITYSTEDDSKTFIEIHLDAKVGKRRFVYPTVKAIHSSWNQVPHNNNNNNNSNNKDNGHTTPTTTTKASSGNDEGDCQDAVITIHSYTALWQDIRHDKHGESIVVSSKSKDSLELNFNFDAIIVHKVVNSSHSNC